MTCGTGRRTRTRDVGVEKDFGGKPCSGDVTETEPCVVNECQVDGMWGKL